MANVSITLRNAPEFRGALWLNEFTGQITVRRPLFGECDEDSFRDRVWTDEDELAVTEWMQDIADINAARNTVFDGVNRVASENRFHLYGIISTVWFGTASRGLTIGLSHILEPKKKQQIRDTFRPLALAR